MRKIVCTFRSRALKSVCFQCLGFLLLTTPCATTSFAAEKQILLRNETITTPSMSRQAARELGGDVLNGLFLLQLGDNPPADWREQLLNARVTVLRAIPVDAFVVRCAGTAADQVQALDFVQYFGKYKPLHKTFSAVARASEEAAEKLLNVGVVLAADAPGIDRARIQRNFRRLDKYSKTSFGALLQGQISNRRINALMQSESVLWIEPGAEPKLYDAVAAEIIGGATETLRPAVHELGFDGKGVVVAVADSGLDFGEAEGIHPDLAGRVDGFFYYGALTDASDEHSHGTHVTGIIAGNGAAGETDEQGYLYGLGIAPQAHIVAQRIFDGLGGYEAPPSLAKLTTDAVRAGAVIGSNSWGDDTQGRYNLDAMEFDALVRDADPQTPGDQQYILEFSAGNAGPGERTIGSPAVAKNVIATGASENNRFDFLIYAEGEDAVADFSSRGPCEDGRVKPDVVAPGTWIASLQSSAATADNAWAGISDLYQYQGGTSQAGPQVSGAAAVFVQYYRETHAGQTPSPALVKAALINSAVDMDNTIPVPAGGTDYVPNGNEGWGRIDLTELIGSGKGFDFTDQTQLLKTGDVYEKRFYIASYLEPLKITMTYTDVPALPASIPALVNDLDLEVVSPSGEIYRGNHFVEGESVSFLASPDSLNNVEQVYLPTPDPGEYVIRVRGSRVLEDSRRDTAAVDQDFALVLSGDVPLPGQGIVSLDRKSYSVPATMGIKLIDFDLAGAPSAQLTLTSASQTIPLSVQLQASGNFGVFTGAVQTANLPVNGSDGRLHVAHGDLIEAVYQDVSPGATRKTTARADLLPPVITDVVATNRFGKEVVLWNTDEPSTSIVYYGTNGVFNLAVTNNTLDQEHELVLSDLVAGALYNFYVVSVDEARNVSTNNNGGLFHVFTARPAATILLVDAYTYTEDGTRDDIKIPVSSYTDALEETGVTYELWDAEEHGSPTFADLKPFRVVIWRINDSFWEAGNTITPAQQNVITQYLGNGGSLLLSSVDILTRIGDVPFRTNVLQIAEFKQHVDLFDECPDCDEDHGVTAIEGADLESLTTGVNVELDYSNYPIYELEPFMPNIGPDLSDVFVPTTNAVPIIFEPGGKVTGIRYPKTGQDAAGRVVFLGFPIDAIPMEGPAPNNRPNILRNLINFLAPGVNGLGSVSLDNTTYSAPARMTIEVADTDLSGMGKVTVTCRNMTSGKSATVQLQEALGAGMFRGFITLVKTNQPAIAGQLQVGGGDLLVVEYFDASARGVERATAEVDLGLPGISDVIAEPDYENAQISWTTDELTDALVQFGESTFLGKTAYSATPDFEHSLILPALVPDKIYYYQVVSRDAAGNTVIDDNGGDLYTFRTLKPLTPPWFDDLESGSEGWSVFDGEESEGTWSLGTPNNFIATEAHSPTQAWGVNHEGFPGGGYIQTFLISPAVELKNGNVAKLKFWHNYDFLGESIIEQGTLQLFTNSQTQPITLATYTDFTAGWEEEVFDLTPHMGKVVQIVWTYELFEFEGGEFPGWFVDDISVEMSTEFKGALQVVNNLAAAQFQVSGPAPFSGQGLGMTNQTAPPGEYVITWEPVPYYTTPPPQTNVLAANSTVRFTGLYQLADSNGNGISDDWELEHLGSVAAQYDGSGDPDGDGQSDYSEFISGTNPGDASSALNVETVELLPGRNAKVTWKSVPGRTYVVYSSSDAQTWQPQTAQLRAEGDAASATILLPFGTVTFFKVEVIP